MCLNVALKNPMLYQHHKRCLQRRMMFRAETAESQKTLTVFTVQMVWNGLLTVKMNDKRLKLWWRIVWSWMEGNEVAFAAPPIDYYRYDMEWRARHGLAYLHNLGDLFDSSLTSGLYTNMTLHGVRVHGLTYLHTRGRWSTEFRLSVKVPTRTNVTFSLEVGVVRHTCTTR